MEEADRRGIVTLAGLILLTVALGKTTMIFMGLGFIIVAAITKTKDNN